MRVLVTGSSGFLGKHVVQELECEGHDVLTPSSRTLNLVSPTCCSGVNGGPMQFGYPVEGPLAYTVEGVDALSFYLWRHKVDAIVHLAATCGGIGINADNPGRFIYENLQMGINILEAARATKVPKVVMLGSVCAYPKFTDVPFKEEDLWKGYPEETNAPYGIAKKTIMEMGIAYSRQYGMDITNLLPANMAGEHDHFDLYSSHVIPALINKFENPKPWNQIVSGHPEHNFDDSVVELWGTGSASREFLYAGDCARAIAISLLKQTGPEPINLGTGREITILELAELIKKVGSYDADIIWDNTKPDGQPRRSLDVSRAKEVLRWEATTTLEETLERTIRWYRANETN